MARLFKTLLPATLLIALSYFTWKPLLAPGFFTIHDDQQIARLFEMDKALKAGQFPVRWVSDLGFGLGYPLFNFYPPLVYYFGETIHLFLRASFIDSTKIVWFVALVGSGLSMYLLAREFFGKIGGVVTALFYVYAPYHAVDAYVRGALAELFSFVWLPLILLFSYKTLRKEHIIYSIFTGVFMGLLMITHNLIFLPFYGLFSLWYLGIFLISNRLNSQSILLAASRYLLITLVTLSLTAFFWLPALAEKQYTLVDELLVKSLASYKIHFVCPEQLWNSAWGYGGSGPGCVDGLSLKIGKPQILASFLALGLLLLKKKKIIAPLFALFVLSAFMTTEYSKLIWDLIPPLWYLQFPWRFLEFATLFSALLAGAVVSFFPGRIKLAVAGVLVAAVMTVGIKYFAPQTYLTEATDARLTNAEEIKWQVSATSFEYLPKGVATTVTPQGTVWVDITKDEALKPRLKFPFESNETAPAKLQFGTANFPGWQVGIDGKTTSIDDNNKYKLITVKVPAGRHVVTGKFTDTPVRFWGNAVTLVSIILLAGFLGYGRYRHQT